MATSKLSITEVSSTTSSTSTDEDKIDIILYPQGPSPILKRQITLTPSSPVISVGRSSKVHSKGFIPAENNAWFDNPVMSRAHAEIIAVFREKPFSVYIKDIESFHGTFHRANNGRDEEQRLTPKQLVKLEHDDILRFGIDIFRSNKTYPPCSVVFKMEIVTPKANDVPRRGFTVPDDVDEEEDENCDTEGDSIDTAFYTKPTPNICEPKGAPSVNSSRLPLIDLTADDDLLPCIKLPISSTVNNCKTSSDIIDLTSEANCESDVEQCIVNPGEPRPSSPASRAPISSEASSNLQSRLNMSQTSDGKIVVPPSCTGPSDEVWGVYHYDELSDEDAESEFCRHQTPMSDASVVSTADQDEMSDAGHSIPDTTLPECEEEYEVPSVDDFDAFSGSYESSDEDEDEDNEDDEDEDNENDDNENEDDEDEDVDEEDDESVESSNDKLHIESPVPLSVFQDPRRCQIGRFLHSPLPSSLRRPVRPSMPDPFTPHDLPHDRDPSPSDAALFKRCPTLDSLPNDSRAQQLGEKTGKFEFFAAREANRAVINQQHSPVPISAIRETLQLVRPDDANVVVTKRANTSRSPSSSRSCAPEIKVIAPGEGWDRAQDLSNALATDLEKNNDDMVQHSSEVPDATSINLDDIDMSQYSAWTASGDKFINNPPTATEEHRESQMVRLQPEYLDMTSAYKFQQSKLATAAQKDPQTRRVPIQDLLAQEPKSFSIVRQVLKDSKIPTPEMVQNLPTSSTPPPLKRSYEEAFNPTKVITHVAPPCKVFSPLDFKAKDRSRVSCENIDTQVTQNNVNAENTIGVEGQVGSVATPIQSEISRPTKRRRLAVAVKVAACVALGGAATFSYLVNTAPVF
ncbi:hypothetical protein F5Y09DRAFT_250253 [Xylaria sp. FL1042]|nr:hypothetical protein F5Y09DRAFT_250253 [Xylaria sp. FL1042]